MYDVSTEEARKLEHDCPPTPRPQEEGKPAKTVPGPYSNFLESTVFVFDVLRCYWNVMERITCFAKMPMLLCCQGHYHTSGT